MAPQGMLLVKLALREVFQNVLHLIRSILQKGLLTINDSNLTQTVRPIHKRNTGLISVHCFSLCHGMICPSLFMIQRDT